MSSPLSSRIPGKDFSGSLGLDPATQHSPTTPEVSAESDFEILQHEIRARFEANRDPNEALATVAGSTLSFFNADGIAIALEQDGAIRCVMSAGAAAPEIGTALNVDSGISGISYREKTSQYCFDARADHRVDAAACEALGLRSILVSPVMAHGSVVGLIELFSATDFFFSAGDVHALEIIANLVGEAHARQPWGSGPHEIPHPFPAAGSSAVTRSQSLEDERYTTVSGSGDGLLSKLRSTATAPDTAAGSERLLDRWRQPRVSRVLLIVLGATILVAGAVALFRVLATDRAIASGAPTAGAIPSSFETVYVTPKSNDAARNAGLKPQAQSVTTMPAAEVPAQTANAVAMPPATMGSPVRTEPEPTLPSVLANSVPATNSASNPVGDRPNVLGGVMASLDTVRAESVATPKSAEPQRVSEVVIGTPEIAPPPLYPQIAKVARVEGTVELSATVNKDGRITEVNVLSGHPMLTTAAIDAVKRWRYKPALLNGEPVEAETTVKIKFTLPR